jgi:hypothetical protein
MINYILIALGAIFALTGIILFIKKIGDSASKVKFLGAELETGSSSLVIFIVGAALIVFGATVKKTNEPGKSTIPENPTMISGKSTDSLVSTNDTKNVTTNNTGDTGNTVTPNHPSEADHPFAEFTLAADQQHVMNDLQITLTLPSQIPAATAEGNAKAAKIRIWRNITHPLSDTAALDPSGGGSGVEMQVFILNAITPVSITDVGQFKFYVFNPVMINRHLASVQVKMYRN